MIVVALQSQTPSDFLKKTFLTEGSLVSQILSLIEIFFLIKNLGHKDGTGIVERRIF